MKMKKLFFAAIAAVSMLFASCTHEMDEILDTYKDQNTAIVLLSLGYDKTAWEILSTLPSTSVVEYLQAIACSRLGQKVEALEHFREACRLDDNMEYRGELDPEISELLK